MKLINIALFLALAMPAAAYAQDDDRDVIATDSIEYEMDDPELEFNELKKGKSKVEFRGGKLKLESKDKKGAVWTATEVRKADPRNADVMFSCPLKFSKFDDKHKSGILFNFRNDDNFHALLLDDKNFYYVVRDRGDEYVEERGRYKSKKKGNVVVPCVSVKNGKLIISVDGIELAEVRLRRPLKARKYGFYTDGESQLEVTGPLKFAVTQYPEGEDSYDGDGRSRRRDYDDY